MSSGQHFKTGVPLALTTSFTGSDVDTATVSIRLEDDRLVGVKSQTEPTSLAHGPDYTKLIWVKTADDSQSVEFKVNVGLYGWVPLKTVPDLSQAAVKSLPANVITPGSNGQILSTVPDLIGYKTAWIDKPEPYTLGLNGTVLMSNGYAGVFQDLQGEMVHSASVTGEIKPLLSDGTGTCSYDFLPASSVAPSPDTGVVSSLVSVFGAAPIWKSLSLIETDSKNVDTTNATVNYAPRADGAGGIAWANPKAMANDRYETASGARVSLSAVATITEGNYKTTPLDSITWTYKTPANVQVFLENTSGTTQYGYTAGTRIPLAALTNSDGKRSAYLTVNGLSASPAAVTVVLFGKFIPDLAAGVAGTVALQDIESTSANWKFVVVASTY
jgi:hypothetical protein